MSGEGGSQGDAANPGGGVQATLFTQDQVNHFAAEAKRGALSGFFKDLGMEAAPTADVLKDTLSKASEYDKLQQGQQSDMERLTTQLGEANSKAEQIPTLEAKYNRAQIAADAGLKSRYWKFIEGATEDEIKASVQTLAVDDLGGGEVTGVQEGSGRPATVQSAAGCWCVAAAKAVA